MKSLRYLVSHCLQVVMNAQHETGRNGRMRSAFRFLGFIVNGLLLVALSLGLFTRWEHSGDTNLLVMFVMGLVVFLIACVLSYYFSMENACTNIAHLVFGFLLGFLALVDQSNLIDDSKEEASRYLLLLSIFTRPMLSISSRFFRATRFASTLLLSTEFLELVGFGAASAALTMERCFDVSILLCAFGLCLADLRMKSLLALPTMIGLSVISVLLFFPALDLSVNPFALGCFFGRLLCDPLIDLFYSGLTVTERWHPYLQAHKMLRRFSVLVLLLAELLFIILSAFTLGNVNRWYILRLLGIIVFGILWVTSHLVLVAALWAFHNRLNNCLGTCALLRTGSKSLDDVMASRGMRQYCLVAEQLVFGALISTIFMAVVCWQEKNGTFIALFMFILPLESLVFGLFHELGSCLGGTCVGYSLIIPTAYCSPDKQPMPLPPELVETINLRATTMLHAIQRFFARYMVENFGCDYSTSGVNLDNLQGKLRTFFDQRTDDGPRHDTYILHYSGHTHNSGEWALAGGESLKMDTLLEWWADRNGASGSRLLIILDCDNSAVWVRAVRQVAHCVAVQAATFSCLPDPEAVGTDMPQTGDFTRLWVDYNCKSEEQVGFVWKTHGISPLYSVSAEWANYKLQLPGRAQYEMAVATYFPRVLRPIVDVMSTICFGSNGFIGNKPCDVWSRWCRRLKLRWFPPTILDTGHGFKLVSA